MRYLDWLEEKGKDDLEKALGAAAKDYCTAAQICLKYHADGLAVSDLRKALYLYNLAAIEKFGQ